MMASHSAGGTGVPGVFTGALPPIQPMAKTL